MDLEAAYLGALSGVSGFEVRDDGKTLALSGDTELSFTSG
jgi:hypothetical protein